MDHNGQGLSNKEKAIAKALQRKIPKLTHEQLLEYRHDFMKMRSEFASWCIRKQMFYTLALLSTCEIRMDEDCPSIAGITNTDTLAVYFNPLIVDLYKTDPDCANFIICHELRHLLQSVNFAQVVDLIDITPIRDVYVKKMNSETDEEKKKKYEKILSKIDDPNNPRWRNYKFRIANTTMDVALHVDLMKVFPDKITIIDKFLQEVYTPYKNGFSWEDIAKDAIAGLNGDLAKINQKIGSMLQNKGPKARKHLEALMNGNVEHDLELLMRKSIGTCTVEGLEDLCNSIPSHRPEFNKDGEWVYYADEFIKFLAKQLEISKESEGEDGEETLEGILDSFKEFDEHDLTSDDPHKQAEAERRIRDAMRRAQEEGRYLEHKAGNAAADAEMAGDTLGKLNDKVKRLLEAIRIKFVRLFAPSNNKQYNYAKINRLLPELKYIPGKMNEHKPKRQAVLVIDTSGSMWVQSWMNEICRAARKLSQEGKLSAMYACDTELNPIDFNGTSPTIKLIGGGGTIFSKKHCEQIMKDLKISKNLDIIYMTDEEVMGIETIKEDKRFQLHIMNIPKILGNR